MSGRHVELWCRKGLWGSIGPYSTPQEDKIGNSMDIIYDLLTKREDPFN